MSELSGMKFEGFIEIAPGLYYCEKDGTPWSNRIKFKKLKAISSGYYKIKIKEKTYYWHRLVWEYFKGVVPKNMQVDHINNNRLDNKINNLQLLNKKSNSRKCLKQKHNTSKLPGVTFYKNNYIGQICINNKILYLGYFSDKLDAFKAYIAAKIKYHGIDSLLPLRGIIETHLGIDYWNSLGPSK